ncbi:PPC domain-containing protein [Tundrisphaera lichenicola]|uniref:PPC domain-containing protein n=1 Tax=Tundrisphaera lichenicola TaxID=2029860 RepID=UPI003EBF1856
MSCTQRRPRRTWKPSGESLDRRELLSTSAGAALVALATPTSNDSRSGATNLGTIKGTKTFDGSVGGTDPRDYYKFVAGRGQFQIRLTNLRDDLDFELLRSDGSRIGAVEDNAGTRSELKTTNLAGGTYFVKIFPATSGARSDYRLSVKQVSGSPASGGGGTSNANPTASEILRAIKPLINAALPGIQRAAEQEIVNTPAQDIGGGSVKIESASVRLTNLRVSGSQVLIDVGIGGAVRAKGSRDISVSTPFGKKKIGSVSGEARAKFSGGATIGISFGGGHLSAKVIRSQRANLTDIRVDRISGLGGSAARALGDFLVQAVDRFGPEVRVRVEQEIRVAITNRLNGVLAQVRL